MANDQDHATSQLWQRLLNTAEHAVPPPPPTPKPLVNTAPPQGRAELPTTARFLACAAAAVRLHGYVSRANAGDAGATSERAWYAAGPCPVDAALWHSAQPTEADLELAYDAARWVASLVTQPRLSSYEHKLLNACARRTVALKDAGVVASAITAYQRHLAQQARQQQRDAEHEARAAVGGAHVGVVGQRLDVTLTVTRVHHTAGYYGACTVLTFEDDRGNELTWFATGEREFAPGARLTGKATVKKHGHYQGRPTTTLTRCSLREVA